MIVDAAKVQMSLKNLLHVKVSFLFYYNHFTATTLREGTDCNTVSCHQHLTVFLFAFQVKNLLP